MLATVLINSVALVSSLTNELKITNIETPIYETKQIYYPNPIIEIPKINLKKEVNPNDPYMNNVDRNIQVIEGSKMPDKIGGNFILASHSGSSKIAYFKHLDQLDYNDQFYIYYKNKIYRYVIGDIYDVPKTGYIEIKRNETKSAVTLITCKKNTNMQTVYIGYLVYYTKTPQ